MAILQLPRSSREARWGTTNVHPNSPGAFPGARTTMTPNLPGTCPRARWFVCVTSRSPTSCGHSTRHTVGFSLISPGSQTPPAPSSEASTVPVKSSSPCTSSLSCACPQQLTPVPQCLLRLWASVPEHLCRFHCHEPIYGPKQAFPCRHTNGRVPQLPDKLFHAIERGAAPHMHDLLQFPEQCFLAIFREFDAPRAPIEHPAQDIFPDLPHPLALQEFFSLRPGPRHCAL